MYIRHIVSHPPHLGRKYWEGWLYDPMDLHAYVFDMVFSLEYQLNSVLY